MEEVSRSTKAWRSTPALPTSAMASPSASMADAMRKFPLSLTILAAAGSVPIEKIFSPIASNKAWQASTAAGAPAPTMNRIAAAGRRGVAARRIVRKHRDDRLPIACPGDAGGLVGAEFEERAALFGIAIEHGDIVSSLDEICRHRRSHSAQPDKSSFHVVSPQVSS